MKLGPVIIDVEGKSLTSEDEKILKHPLVGGVILFARNYESPQQVTHLIQQIHVLRTPKLLVSVDHEGGRVQRFREGFTRLPAMRLMGEIFQEHPKRARNLAQTCGWLMAVELRSVGVDYSYAPVLDLYREISDVIGDRAFDRNPDVIAELAHYYMKGMHEAGMAAVGKHFPGHGSVGADSHLDLPIDDRDYQTISMDDLIPFERMINYGLAAIMPAHVVYSKVDQQPAGFSQFWLSYVLREQLGFQGVIFSDDLNMAAADVAGSFTQRAELAISAGCDMVLVCNNREGALEVLTQLRYDENPASNMRMLRMHGSQEYHYEQLGLLEKWHEAVKLMADIQSHPSQSLPFN